MKKNEIFRKRAIFCISSTTIGGAEKQFIYLINGMKDLFDIKIVVFAPYGLMSEELSKTNLDIIYFNFKKRFYL